MSRKKCYRGEINITYFFIVALLIHLSLFIFREYSIKGDSNLGIRSNGAPISVQVKSDTFKKPRPSSGTQMEAKAEKKVEPENKAVKEDFLSKIKDKKKEKKIEKKKEVTPQKEIKKQNQKTKETDNNSNATQNQAPATAMSDPNSDQDFLSGNFSIGTDGSVVATSADGIDYQIIKQIDPEYPKQAKRVRYSQTVVVKAKFLVGLNGNIENIKILESHSKLGFDKAVIDALNQWKFKPIFYKNKNIKVYFTKSFVFENID